MAENHCPPLCTPWHGGRISRTRAETPKARAASTQHGRQVGTIPKSFTQQGITMTANERMTIGQTPLSDQPSCDAAPADSSDTPPNCHDAAHESWPLIPSCLRPRKVT